MGPKSVQSSSAHAWALAVRQHGVVSRKQLLATGLPSDAITHRVKRGRLHPTPWHGVYAVGRPELSRHGVWMAAVLSCGREAVLSHCSAAALWGIRAAPPGDIEVSVPSGRFPRRAGVHIHRRALVGRQDVTALHRIPVTTPIRTLIDLATSLDRGEVEAAVNAADKLDLISPEALRRELDRFAGRPGVGVLRALLDRATFALTDSQLERRFLPIARRAGLGPPLTQHWVNGFRVDFYWPDLGLVVETDGLRYHRTAAQQTADRRRDQAHAAAGLTAVRFSHAQVAFEAEQVQATLARVARHIAAKR
jgi:very-short-patch-repair endonuclease/predicted transcriptional regulator of viral defense system